MEEDFSIVADLVFDECECGFRDYFLFLKGHLGLIVVSNNINNVNHL